MLLELMIQNIALIESLRIEFAGGLNVLTGETGAGKSIIVDSLGLALGGRADRELIRTGAEKARVQALFDISKNPRAQAAAREIGVETEDFLLALTRELSASGRNICRVSGMVVPLAAFKTLVSTLADIHGQHEHQSLMDPEKHMGFLDAFGPAAQRALVAEVGDDYQARMRLAGKIKRRLQSAQEVARESEYLRAQVQEIQKAKLKPGEEESLLRACKKMENAEKIRAGIAEAYDAVYAGQANAQALLDRACSALEKLCAYDERFCALSERLRATYYAAQDIGMELQSEADQADFDPAMADKLYERLDIIRRLEKKYGPTVDDVLGVYKTAQARLAEIDGGGEDLEAEKKALRAMDASLKEKCRQLSAMRASLAEALSKKIERHLRDLGMGKTRLVISVKSKKISADGADQVEFLIAPNPGEPLKPLSAIASGGEISRVMLAIKAVALDEYGVDTMVFDEIDTGVSGRVAQAVGEKMCLIARSRQVLCVTHLAQIAAMADRHFVVEKTQGENRTQSDVRVLDFDGRVREISRLVGGAEDSESAVMHARNMVFAAEELKTKLARV